MKLTRIFTVALIAMALLSTSCNRGATPAVIVPGMEVTYSTIDGSWELIAWNGKALDEGTYCYIDFNRTEQRFEMWSNFGSMYADDRSGTFTIEKNEYGEFILSGIYDYGVGDWNDTYRVTMYTPGREMRWESTTTDDTYTYARIDAIPEL
ncbi:MAG: lipocalin family protein [Alistipes sp.]|nr:lipocalin family protein [Alistipes sp.]